MIDTKRVAHLAERLTTGMSQVIVGRDQLKQRLLIALLAGGHVIIEGLPGTGKTKLARTFAELIGGRFKRIQCVPDMLPADVTGFYMHSLDGVPKLIEGPIFANVLLADELNRATPRTQAALLESMQERQVTIERATFKLPAPFIVIATQQQTGAEGTYPLTNVQADRFLLRHLNLHPTPEEESLIVANIDRIEEPVIEPVTTLTEIIAAQEVTRKVHVAPEIVAYITSLTHALRSDPDVAMAPSTRASIALYKCARARALLEGREFVIPDDVKHLFVAAVEHRVSVRPESEMDDVTPHMVLDRAVQNVPVPR